MNCAIRNLTAGPLWSYICTLLASGSISLFRFFIGIITKSVFSLLYPKSFCIYIIFTT